MVSLSRPVVFGPLVILAVMFDNDWRSGLVWLIAGLSTDYIDGWLAIRLNAMSDFGKRWVDPVCDFTFCFQVQIAYVFQDDQWSTRLWWAIPMPLVAVLFKSLKEQRHWRRIADFAYGASPGYYLACVIVFVYLFAQKALTDSEMALVNRAYLPIILLAAYFKRHRLEDWRRALQAWWKKHNPAVD